jgi:methylthioribulose-1-phosphate dehydratase
MMLRSAGLRIASAGFTAADALDSELHDEASVTHTPNQPTLASPREGNGRGSELEKALARELCETMATVHRRGWCEGTGGNFSCSLEQDPLLLLMAPSGVDKGRLSPEELIVVDHTGMVVKGSGRASAETQLHITIVEETGARAVLHTHSQAGTLLSQQYRPDRGKEPGELMLRDLEMLKGLEGVDTHATSISIPVLANDQNLQRLSSVARPWLKRAPHGLLIGGHGLYAWGRDLANARRHLEIHEFLLEQHWRMLLLHNLQAAAQR